MKIRIIHQLKADLSRENLYFTEDLEAPIEDFRTMGSEWQDSTLSETVVEMEVITGSLDYFPTEKTFESR